MVNRITNDFITTFKKTGLKKGGVVILSLSEYEELLGRIVPNYYLGPKEEKRLDKLQKQALKEYKEGKCKTIKSLADLK